MRLFSRFYGLRAFTALCFLTGCNVLFGFDENVFPAQDAPPYPISPGGAGGQGPGGGDIGSGSSGGGNASGGSGGSAGGTSGTGGSGPLPTACDPAEQPDDAKGVFVDASAPPGGKGTRAEPFASLPSALAALANLPSAAGATLYLRQGAAPYALDAPLALPPLAQGVGLVLDGGWGDAWQRDCSEGAASKTVVRGKSAAVSPVLSASGGSLTLRRLTVQTADTVAPTAQAQSGASLTAVYVAGDTSLLLDTSGLRAGIAGEGGAAPSTQPVSGTRACNGLTDCQTGASTTTPAAGGGTNTAFLMASGFAPGDGQDGQIGTGGENGTRDAQSDGKENASCVTCPGHSQATCEAPGNPFVSDTTSADGKCGCGGKGGPGGPGGRGGGASVALWVGSATAKVAVFGSTLTTNGGGKGSSGSPGGQGSSGLAGVGGLPICRALAGGSACSWDAEGAVCNVVPFSSRSNTPGLPGGPGGSGGPGGPGGPGAGGPSYALVAPTGATVQVDATSTLAPGQGGLGGDGVTTAEALAQKRY